jgi:hypothetical protein
MCVKADELEGKITRLGLGSREGLVAMGLKVMVVVGRVSSKGGLTTR